MKAKAHLLALGTPGLLLACAWRQGALEPRGPKASAIGGLGSVFFWVTLAVFVAVVAAAMWGFWRGQRGVDSRESKPPVLSVSAQTEKETHRAVSAATAVSVILLALLLVASISTGQRLSNFAPAKPLHVKVTAYQWWWRIEYPGKTPDEAVVTANELHVPAGLPVELELESADVIHSFWIPSLDGKHDLIPGHVFKTLIQADAPGDYGGRCAEFCGYQHAHMDLLVVAEPPSNFAGWLNAQRAPAAAPSTLTVQHGQQVFERGPCSLCHSISGSQAHGGVGPDLSHFASRRTVAAGAAPMSRAALVSWIEDPNQLKPGSHMPPVSLTRGDLNAVVDYLETLK
jgi:cytochrome c oxidase subunit 2